MQEPRAGPKEQHDLGLGRRSNTISGVDMAGNCLLSIFHCRSRDNDSATVNRNCSKVQIRKLPVTDYVEFEFSVEILWIRVLKQMAMKLVIQRYNKVLCESH